jgi:Tfp pilus assembly protein PilF
MSGAPGHDEQANRTGGRFVPTWVVIAALVTLLALSGVTGFVMRRAFMSTRAVVLHHLQTVQNESVRTTTTSNTATEYLSQAFDREPTATPSVDLVGYETALRHDPNDVVAMYGRGMALMDLGRQTEAESALWNVLKCQPGHPQAAAALGDYYAQRGEYRSLLVAVHPAVKLHPSDARLQCLMGLAYENIGRKGWATARYQLALKAQPGAAQALAGLQRLASGR